MNESTERTFRGHVPHDVIRTNQEIIATGLQVTKLDFFDMQTTLRSVEIQLDQQPRLVFPFTPLVQSTAKFSAPPSTEHEKRRGWKQQRPPKIWDIMELQPIRASLEQAWWMAKTTRGLVLFVYVWFLLGDVLGLDGS